jgi:hypothetical protein
MLEWLKEMLQTIPVRIRGLSNLPTQIIEVQITFGVVA